MKLPAMPLNDLLPKPLPRSRTLFERLAFALFLTCVIGWYPLQFFWPAEGDRPFDAAVWKANSNTGHMNVRTSMRKDLVERLKKERWSPTRVATELGAGYVYNGDRGQRIAFAMGHRRGAWPFRSGGFMTAFDPWTLHIYFNENGIFQDAHVSKF